MDFRLYINGKECDLDNTFAVQMSYEAEDTESPSAVLTEYSKTITLPRTGNNDLIFNYIGDLDRVQDNSDEYFTPLERNPMTLTYRGGTVLDGYAKLESVSDTSYSVALFSGVADFFYSFTTDNEGNTYTLDNLRFETDLDYNITKENVRDAWDRISKISPTGISKWDTINFAPMYNGLPEDIDASKALINISGSSVFTTSAITDGSSAYTTYQNTMLALAEFSEEHTEWEVQDLRSYCQRPVLNVKKMFEAIKRTAEDKRFILDLDKGFFNDLNPYYSKAWITMPMLSKLDLEGETWTGSVVYTSTSTGVSPKTSYEMGVEFSGQLNGAVITMPSVNGKSNLNIKFSLNADIDYDGNELYTGYIMHNYNSDRPAENFTEKYTQWNNSGTSIQFYMSDANTDTIIAASPTYTLSSMIDGRLKTFASPVNYGTTEQGIAGTFKNNGDGWKFTGQGGETEFDAVIEDIPKVQEMYLTMVIYSYNPRLYREKEYWLDTIRNGEVVNKYFPVANSGDLTFTSFGKTGSNALITKKLMFGSMNSVADYMIGYAKTFGLKWVQEGNTISLMTRNRYYAGTINDYTEDSDRSNVSVEPLVYKKRYFDLKNEMDDTYLTEKYKKDWNADYGRQRLDTGYRFDSDVQDFFSDMPYKGGVYGKMKSNYFRHIKGKNWDGNNLEWIPSPILDKISYTLVRNGNDPDDTKDVECAMDVIRYINFNATARYDCNDRMCFQDSDNGAVDGENVLLFFDGFKENRDANGYSIDYMLTDDLDDMFALNGDSATWLCTNTEFDARGRRIAYKCISLPVFSRYYTDGTNSIVLSMDFGEPRELYCDLSSSSESTIYSRFWRRYLGDQMNADARKIKVPLLYRTGMDAQTLRDFIRIDNQIYMLNSADYNIGETGTTSSELIRINDIYDYTQGQRLIYPDASLSIEPTGATIGYDGGMLSFTINYENAENIDFQTDAEWMQGRISGNALYIDVMGNTGDERKGHIWLTGTDLGGMDIVGDAVEIVQDGTPIEPTTLKMTNLYTTQIGLTGYTSDGDIVPYSYSNGIYTWEKPVAEVRYDKGTQTTAINTFGGFNKKTRLLNSNNSTPSMGSLFKNALSLTNLNSINTAGVKNFIETFENAGDFDISGWDLTSVERLEMFNLNGKGTVVLPQNITFNSDSVSMGQMFSKSKCSEIRITGWKIKSASLNKMFYQPQTAQTIYFDGTTIEAISSTSNMFSLWDGRGQEPTKIDYRLTIYMRGCNDAFINAVRNAVSSGGRKNVQIITS